MPGNQQFDVNAARKAGYSDDEILGHLTSTRAFDVQGAIKAGYSKADIIGHLSTSALQGPSADQLAVGALAKQGLGPAASPGQLNQAPVFSRAEETEPDTFGGLLGSSSSVGLPRTNVAPSTEAPVAGPYQGGPFGGLPELVGGASQIANSKTRDEKYQGGSKLIGGAMEEATPFILPGLANPAGLAAGYGIGAAAGKAARKGTELAGGSEAAQQFAEDVGFNVPAAAGIGVSASSRGGKVSAFGGRIQAGVEVAPEVVRGAVKFGETRMGMEVPRVTEPTVKVPDILPPAPKVKTSEPVATPIGNIQHPEATAPEENIGEFSEKTISNFKKQQLRAMQEGDTAASDALAGMLDADAAKKAGATPPTERRLIRRSDTSQMVLDQLHTELRATKDQGERAQLQAAIDRETDLGNRDAIAKETSQPEQPSQSTQAEPRTTPKASRDIEGEVPTQGASQPISEQVPAFTAEQIEHRNNFLKYQDEYTRIQAALDKGASAKAKGFDRGSMNDAQVAWHQAELVRLERKMGDSLRNYARVSPPEHIDQMRAGLVQGLQNTKGTADRLSKLIQTDKAAKQLRRMLPELPPAQKQAGRKLLGDIPDTTQYALKQAKFYSPKLKPRVDEAHREIGSTLSSLIQQYGEGNPVATKYAVAFKEGLKGDALTEQHVKTILAIVPAQAKGEVGKLLNILKNETPVVLYHPSIRGTASSALPEVNLRNLRQLLGKQVSGKNPQLTPEQRTDMKVLSATDPQSGKLERENQSRGLVENLQKQADKRANFLQKQLGAIDKASGAGKRANEKILAGLISKHRTLKEIQTHELESLVADTKTLHKVFPQMNMMQQAKAKLQGELDKRNDVARQQQEILKFKVGQVLQPTPKSQVIAPVSSQLPGARYFADEWYQTPELAAAASVMDSKISKMSASVIGKYLGPLAKKVARGDKQSVALLNAYNKRLVELGKPEALPETLLEKQAKNITNPQEAPIGPQKGDVVEFQLPTGAKISGTIESISGDMVKIIRPNGQKNVQPLSRMVQKEVASTPSVIESKSIEAQRTEKIEPVTPTPEPPANPTGASRVGGNVSAPPSPSKQLAINSLAKLQDADLAELAPKLIDWAKQRPDLSPEGRHELIAKMVDAALAVPKEKANKIAYDLSRLNAPPLSTWTAETGGDKARVAAHQQKAPDPVPESPKSSTSPELEAAKKRAVETMQVIEKQAGDLGINRLRAIAKGLDVSMPGKIYALDKALTLYLDGLKVGDPNALARARDFLLAQNGEPNTGKMSLFGLDRVVKFLTNSQKIQIPVPSPRLENIRKAQAAELQGPSLVDKLRSIPYTVLTKMYDQFQYLDQNPTRFEKWFAPELIKNFGKRTGIREIRIDTNPWKQARLAYGGGGGVVHAAAIELSRVAKEAGDRGLLDNLKAYLNLVAYDRAIRNIRGRATVALAEAKRLRANADQLEAHIQLGAEPPTRYTEVTSLRKQAKQHKEDAKMFAKKLVRKEVVPESYTQASIAQDLRLLQTDLGPSDFSKVEGWANRIYAQLKMSWDDLHQAGMISGQVHQRGELLGRGYIPLARILETFQDVNRTYGTSSMNVRTRKALQELEGSKLYNVDPIDAALNQIQLASREVQKNLVAKSVLNLGHMDPNGYGQAIKIPQAGYKLAATEGTMVHWDDGEKYTYVVPRFLASVIENATPAGSAVVGAGLLRATAGMFRLGATLANLRFSIPNATRDIQDYASLSKTGMIIKGVLHPFEFGKIVHDWTATLKNTISEDSEYLQMMRARAGFSTIQRNISVSPEMLRTNALRRGGFNPFSKVIHTVEQFNDIVENNTKLTSFKRNRELITNGKQGPLTKQQLDAVAWETRNYGGSPDFASKGTMSAAINLLWMFFNAKIQGAGRTVRRMLEPRRAAMLLGTYTMMGLALMSHNLEIMAPENDGTFEYQHIPNTDKQNYYIILTPGTYQTSTGGVRHNYYKVSKGHLGQLISNPIEDAIEAYAIGHVSISQTALDFAGNLLPGQFNFREGKLAEGAVSGAISSWNPLIKEPIDQARNVDSFKNISIEPRGMENLENPERYDPNTSLTTRKLSRIIYDNSGKESGAAKMPILGPVLTSPMRMQHAVSGFGAGVADDALRISDWALGQDRNPKVPLEGTEALAHTPVVGGVISRFVGSPLDQIEKDLETEFYSAADKARVQEGTLNHLAKTSPPEAKAYLKQNIGTLRMSKDILKLEQEMGKLRNYQKQVLANNKLDAGQKRQYIQKLHETRMKLLKFFHEKLAPKFVTN